ncbi:MAG TPA: hypothetical protein VIE65_01895 [Methylobacter sp.]
MSESLSLKQIALQFVNRIVNPNFENKAIWAFVGSGFLFVSVSQFFSLQGDLQVDISFLKANIKLDGSPSLVTLSVGLALLGYGAFAFYRIKMSNNQRIHSVATASGTIAASITERVGFEQYCQALYRSAPNQAAVIKSHPRGERIFRDLYELHRSSRFPCAMSVSGEILENPIYEKMPSESIEELTTNYQLSNNPNFRLMPEDLYLVKADDGAGQPRLLQYFSGARSSGWQTWLFPHGFQIQEPDLDRRLELDARDFETLIGIGERKAEIDYIQTLDYLVSFKPDFGYRDTLVAYCFMFCSVRINSSYEHLQKVRFDIAKGDQSRSFKWFYPEELQADDSIAEKNSDLIRAIHTLYGTSLVPIPISLTASSMAPVSQQRDGIQ